MFLWRRKKTSNLIFRFFSLFSLILLVKIKKRYWNGICVFSNWCLWKSKLSFGFIKDKCHISKVIIFCDHFTLYFQRLKAIIQINKSNSVVKMNLWFILKYLWNENSLSCSVFSQIHSITRGYEIYFNFIVINCIFESGNSWMIKKLLKNSRIYLLK